MTWKNRRSLGREKELPERGAKMALFNHVKKRRLWPTVKKGGFPFRFLNVCPIL
jgi:hypothetical protein